MRTLESSGEGRAGGFIKPSESEFLGQTTATLGIVVFSGCVLIFLQVR